jgi:hypothetical protein
MTRRGLRGRRRGSALILVLLMTLAVAALAVAAIFMSSSATLLSRFYDKERRFAYAAQSGIDRVVSRLQLDSTFAITSTTPVSALDLTTLVSASDDTLGGVTVRVWAARTGDTTSSGPITVSLLAQVADASGTRYVRRVDLRRMHFGQWAFISNFATSSSTLPFFNSSLVAGRVHNNQSWVTITQASYRDSITSTGSIGVTNASNLRMGAGPNQRRIPWPQADTLLRTYRLAADTFDVSGSFPPRVELVWLDLDSDAVADRDEGFMRIFVSAGNDSDDHIDRIEARPQDFDNGSGTNEYVWWDDQVLQNQCGAFYRRNGVWQFFPVATHRQAWAWSIIDSASGTPGPPTGGNANTSTAVRAILTRPTARCFPSGSPYLVNTERFTNFAGAVGTSSSHDYPFGVRNAAHRYGGQDTTLTMTVRQCNINNAGDECFSGLYTVGTWRTLSAVAGRETLLPLDRNGEGAVVHFDNDIRLSGVVAGRVSIAVDGDVSIVDHITYAGGPNDHRSDCSHLLGVIARNYIRIEENLIAHRSRVGNGAGSSNSQTVLGGANHFPLHGSFMSLTFYFGVEGNDFRQSNTNTSDCEGSSVSMGCIRHLGSTATSETRSFSTNSAQGRGGRYVLTPDACMETAGYRPPLYPGTNRYKILRSVDVRATHVISEAARNAYFASLQGTSDIP